MHKCLYAAAALAAVLLAGCAGGPDEQTAGYVCDSGRVITVTYRGVDTAILQMGPRQIEMQAAPHPIGTRYVSPQLQWVVQIDDEEDEAFGTLFTPGYDGGPGEIAEQCRETHRD